jgi:hypothetical protein
MLKTLAGNLVKLLLLYCLAFGLVGLLRQYWLVTLPIDIEGKPTGHVFLNYLWWFLMFPVGNLADMLRGVWIDDPEYLPDLAVVVLFLIVAGLGLMLRRLLLVGLALAGPIIYYLWQFLTLRIGSPL